MAHHEPGNRETQTKLPFRLPRSTRAGYVMDNRGYSRKDKYHEDFDDEDICSDDWNEADGVKAMEDNVVP